MAAACCTINTKMKKAALIIAVIVIALCGIVGLASRFKPGGNAAAAQVGQTATVTRGSLIQKVVETGTIDAVTSVELKSRVDGRLAKLLVSEGDQVKKGQLVALIDPRETQLKVNQDRANLSGAESAAAKARIEWEQRQITAQRDYDEAKLKLAQLNDQLKVQPTLTKSNIDSAIADLNTANQERDRLKASILPQEQISAKSDLQQAQAGYDNALAQYSRQVALQQKGFASSKDVEDAKLALAVDQAKLASTKDNYNRIFEQTKLELDKADESVRHAKAEVDTANANKIQDVNKKRDYEMALADLEKAKVGLRDTDAMKQAWQQAESQVEQFKNVLADSERNLGETNIVSPLDGIVSKKEIQEGELVASISGFSSGTPILRIEDRRSLRVILDVNEIDVAKLLEGMKAEVKVDALPNKVFHGIVKRIAPASTNIQATENASSSQTGTTDSVVKYEVEIWLTSTDPHLRSGMSAKCTLEPLHKDNVLQLPIEFVGKDGDKSYVLVSPKTRKGKAQRVDVVTGDATGSMIEIVSGVSEGTAVDKPTYSGPPRRTFMQGGPD